MDNYIFPLDPADGRPDLSLWSGWPERTTHLTNANPPEPAPVDMLECFCGEHVWIAADGRRWTWDNELHRCPPIQTPLEAAETAYIEARMAREADALAACRSAALETLTSAPTITDLVIE